MALKKLPAGVENFRDVFSEDYYYVDKTGMIKELLEKRGQVNLFARPRRFGKSLNMSMLKNFFEIGTDPSLFDGLAISREKELCEKHLGQYPVISLSLKDVWGDDFESAKRNLWDLVEKEANRFDFLLESGKLSNKNKSDLLAVRDGVGNMEQSLSTLSQILYKHYGKQVIILIDEYDVPLQKAEMCGYYGDMVHLISRFFSSSLKTNDYMYFSVVTGCLRIAKESIFTGFNNPQIHTIVDNPYDEWFGFTDDEVRAMLDYYGVGEYYETTKEWYDGYRFGTIKVYCPWDVINYCFRLCWNDDKTPENYWANTSGNDMILRFVEMADEDTRMDLEILSQGKSVDKDIHMELTYAELDKNIDNLWSVLFTTGYLTWTGRNEDGSYRLVIPNKEIMSLFGRQVKDWFMEKIEGGLDPLFEAFDNDDGEAIEKCINEALMDSISFFDGGNTMQLKEMFYHGLLLGMLRSRRTWIARSNREAGHGRADIIVTDRRRERGYVIEVKCSEKTKDLDKAAKRGLAQIDNSLYDAWFDDFEIEDIHNYGIAFCKKECRVAQVPS